jgi:hypothetical protein
MPVGGTTTGNYSAKFCVHHPCKLRYRVWAKLHFHELNPRACCDTRIWPEALIIYGIHKYIAILMNFRNIISIPRVLLNFCKVEMSKNKAFSPDSGDAEVVLVCTGTDCV